jgi:hypothetical protein
MGCIARTETSSWTELWIARHDHHEVRPLHRRPGDPPRRIQPARVRMQKQPRHHLRVERRLAKFARVAAGDLAQIEALSDQGTISRDRWSSAT